MRLFLIVGFLKKNEPRGWTFSSDFSQAIDSFRSCQRNGYYEWIGFYRLDLQLLQIEMIGEWKS